MADLTTIQRYKFILEEFQKRKVLDAYDKNILDELSIGIKQLGRILKDIYYAFDSIEEFKDGKKLVYKLITPIDVFIEAFDNSENIGWLFQLAHEGDKTIFKDLEKHAKKSKELYMFKNSPFEDIGDVESKQHFKRLKNIIKEREYAKIKFRYDDTVYDNLKCLKLVFMDNNWYVAFVDNDDLRFGRINFIQRVDFGSKYEHFQLSSVEKHHHFLEYEIQNSMTLYDKKKKTAILKATPNIAKYFKADMKKFISSQTFQKECEDGSIVFRVTYTQELEILPFIQKWLPDLIILEPKKLKDAYYKKLQSTIENHIN